MEDLTRRRGRMRISETLQRALISKVQVACTTDDLSRDVLHNQIIKTTLEWLTKTREIDIQLPDEIVAVLATLSDVRSISLSGSHFARVQLHGNNAFYDFLLAFGDEEWRRGLEIMESVRQRSSPQQIGSEVEALISLFR